MRCALPCAFYATWQPAISLLNIASAWKQLVPCSWPTILRGLHTHAGKAELHKRSAPYAEVITTALEKNNNDSCCEC